MLLNKKIEKFGKKIFNIPDDCGDLEIVWFKVKKP